VITAGFYNLCGSRLANKKSGFLRHEVILMLHRVQFNIAGREATAGAAANNKIQEDPTTSTFKGVPINPLLRNGVQFFRQLRSWGTMYR